MTQLPFSVALEAQRPYLLRYAMLQLRSRETAEDAVQETLLAALAAESGFAGRSSLRTWVTGILKHKIVDAIRRAARETSPGMDENAYGEEFDALFDDRDHWNEHPPAWRDPDAALHEKQFMAALERCLAALPGRTAQVFLMREHLGLDTAEICKELGLSSTHCWVLLHRARMALRTCLDAGWFAK